jgi:hypothetical protein
VLSSSEYVFSAVPVILIQLPDFGLWSMSPSRISDSDTRSKACSELIILPDRYGYVGCVRFPGIVPAITLRILRSTARVNHRFTGLSTGATMNSGVVLVKRPNWWKGGEMTSPPRASGSSAAARTLFG